MSTDGMTRSHRSLLVFRIVWILYALALFTATHWPGLALPPTPFSRMDLIVHGSVFALWTLLLYHCRWIGPMHCPKRWLVYTGIVGVLYAVFDEFTQPLFRRTLDPLDLAADIAGVLVMCLLIAIARSMMPGKRKVRSEQA